MKKTKAKRVPLVSVKHNRLVGEWFDVVVGGLIIATFRSDEHADAKRLADRLRAAIRKEMRRGRKGGAK